jgi:tungstate transport system substrate-binding protein
VKIFLTFMVAVTSLICIGLARSNSNQLRLATTTSVYDSGLLDEILIDFQTKFSAKVQVIAVGTGQALQLAQRGDVDAVFVHAPDLERAFIAAGLAQVHSCIAVSRFIIVGPVADPAKVASAPSALEGFKRIASTQSTFISRGDNSGTYAKEQSIWKLAGLTPKGLNWYLEAGSGMSATLTIAGEKRAYTLSDIATYLVTREQAQLARLFAKDDPVMLNQYSFMTLKNSTNNLSEQFRRFLLLPSTQKVISNFGRQRYGESLFTGIGGKCQVPVVENK